MERCGEQWSAGMRSVGGATTWEAQALQDRPALSSQQTQSSSSHGPQPGGGVRTPLDTGRHGNRMGTPVPSLSPQSKESLNLSCLISSRVSFLFFPPLE